jgi:hypothetical protein
LKRLVSYLPISNGDSSFLNKVGVVGDSITLAQCVKEIMDIDRWWNVVVVSESIDRRFGINAPDLASRLLGVANVFALPLEHESDFTNHVGQDFAVYGGAARTFRAGFNLLDSTATSHPVLRAPFGENRWQVDRAYHIIGTDTFAATIRRPDYREKSPGFFDIRQMIAKARTDTSPH